MLRLAEIADSRGAGYSDPADYLAVPGVTGSYGQGYTDPVPADAITLTGGGGTGAVIGFKLWPSGHLAIGLTARGSGYTTATLPTLVYKTIAGVTVPDYQFSVVSGGWLPDLETYLRANGYAGLIANSADISGMHMENTYASYQAQGCEISAGDPTQSLIYICLGVNDALNARTAAQFGADAKLLSDVFTGQGYAVMFSLPFGVDASTGGAYNNAQGTSTNALLVTDGPYQTALKNLAATNPSRIFTGADEYALVAAHKEYLADGLHQNRAGSVALAAIKGPSIAAVLRTLYPPAATGSTAFDSPPSNEVLVTPGYVPLAPVITSFSGLSIFPNPRVVINWGAGNWGDIEVQRLTVGAVGAAASFAVISTLVPTTPGDRTTVPTTFTDTNVVFGVAYKYRLIAQGTA